MKTAFQYRSILELSTEDMAVWWGCISKRGRGRGGEGDTDDQLCLISHH